MADLTSASTVTLNVAGNRKIITVDVSSAGGSTSDTVHIPHLTAPPSFITASYRSTVATFDTLFTSQGRIGVQVTTAARGINVTLNRSSDGLAMPVTIRAEGR